MGLISSYKLDSKILKLFLRLNDFILFCLYFIGVIWFVLLSQDQFNSRTYFSESALLPGLVDSEFYHDEEIDNWSFELKKLLDERSINHDLYYKTPYEWLLKKFKDVGLDVHLQNYSFSYPHGFQQHRQKRMIGTNFYAILKSARSSSTESLILHAPFSGSTQFPNSNYHSISLMLALAKSFRRKSYWAKDIIFLVTDNQDIGLEAWLSSFHFIPNKYINAEVLKTSNGVIQAALVLEMGEDRMNSFHVRVEGSNGKLVNLDLVNTVDRLFYKFGLKIKTQHQISKYKIFSWQNKKFGHQATNMLLMAWRQASCFPTGLHGIFGSYGIEALTIRGEDEKGAGRRDDLNSVGRAVEGIMRSLNNLLEKLHQSFFFYLLPSTSRYVSIALYMPPIGFILSPIVLKVVIIWLKLTYEKEASIEKYKKVPSEEKKEKNKILEKKNEQKSINSFQPTDSSTSSINFLSINLDVCLLLQHILAPVALGICSFKSVPLFLYVSRFIPHLPPQDILFFGIIVFFFLSFFQPFVLKRVNNSKELMYEHLFLIFLLCSGAFLSTLSLINVSLSFFIGLIWIPVILINKPYESKLLNFSKKILIIFSSPMSLLFVASIIQTTASSYSSLTSFSSLLASSFQNLSDNLFLSYLYFNHHSIISFPLLTIFLLPLWSFMWVVSQSKTFLTYV